MNKINKLVLTVISACIMLCGCDIKMETPDNTEDTLPVIATTEVSEESEPEPQPFPVTINGVAIEKAPERVASLSPSLTEIIYEMGYGDRLVGKGSYCDFPEEVSLITDIGRPSKPDINTIISLSPEILFTATSIPLKDQYKLEENGIKTIYIPYPSTIEEFGRIYSALGMVFEGAFDGEATGMNCFSSIEDAFTSAQIDLGSFVYITEGLTVATGDTFEHSVLSAFGENIGEPGVDYGYKKEYLVEFQPDLILLNGNYTIDDLLSDEVYSQLTAVVNGNVYSLDNTYFERPSGRITELIESLKDIGC